MSGTTETTMIDYIELGLSPDPRMTSLVNNTASELAPRLLGRLASSDIDMSDTINEDGPVRHSFCHLGPSIIIGKTIGPIRGTMESDRPTPRSMNNSIGPCGFVTPDALGGYSLVSAIDCVFCVRQSTVSQQQLSCRRLSKIVYCDSRNWHKLRKHGRAVNRTFAEKCKFVIANGCKYNCVPISIQLTDWFILAVGWTAVWRRGRSHSAQAGITRGLAQSPEAHQSKQASDPQFDGCPVNALLASITHVSDCAKIRSDPIRPTRFPRAAESATDSLFRLAKCDSCSLIAFPARLASRRYLIDMKNSGSPIVRGERLVCGSSEDDWNIPVRQTGGLQRATSGLVWSGTCHRVYRDNSHRHRSPRFCCS
ncbi:hypothetical protein J6590_004384 [Homalodisca vitripennis]|nr:hypothetical protein J6590_004384 [Homalodisca vitripennis]